MPCSERIVVPKGPQGPTQHGKVSIKGNNRRPSTYFARKLNKRERCWLRQAEASKAQHILVIIFLLLFLMTQVATLLAWIFGWATSSSGYFENSTWSKQQFQCIQPSMTRWGQQGQPWWRLRKPHAATIGVAVGVTIGIIFIMSSCCYFCCRSLLALA